MNGNDMLNAMTDVDGKHILSAEKKHVSKKRIFIGTVSAVAAAAVIAVSIGIVDKVNKNEPVIIDENLPMLDAELVNAGMGFEGVDYAHIENGNPWTENMNFKTLPVYRSPIFNQDHELMMNMLQTAAEALGYDFSEMEIDNDAMTDEKKNRITEQFKGYGASEEEIIYFIKNVSTQSNITASNDDMYMSIDSVYHIHIVWSNIEDIENEGLDIPDEYKPSAEPSREELEKAGEYVINTYPELFNINNPVFNPYSEYERSAEFYSGGSDKEKFHNFNFNHVHISFNNAGKVGVIGIDTDRGFEKIGDYPIITPEEAKEMLYNGNYLTTITNYKIKGGEEITRVELMYKNRPGYEYAMPYYRMLVKLTDEDLGINSPEIYGGVTYGAYYVPAVEAKYLNNLPDPELIYNGAPVNKLPKEDINKEESAQDSFVQTEQTSDFDLGITSNEPTFITGLDGQSVRTTDITKILDITDSPVTIDKLTPDSNDMKVFCDGFQYFKEPILIAYNSYENPEMFENGQYTGETPENNNEYKRVNIGDEICGLKLTKATTEFLINQYNNERTGSYYYCAEINEPLAEFEGSVTIKGFLCASPKTYYDNEGGQLIFTPCEDILPLGGTTWDEIIGNMQNERKHYSNHTVYDDTNELVSFNEMWNIALGGLTYKDIDMNTGDVILVNATINNIKYYYGGVGADLEKVEVLSDILLHVNSQKTAPHN